jgi:transposase-like protein
MTRQRSAEEIVRILEQVQTRLLAGGSIREAAKELGINPGTLCRWQQRYGGVGLDEARRLLVLEKENKRLKQIVAELELDRLILKEALQGK